MIKRRSNAERSLARDRLTYLRQRDLGLLTAQSAVFLGCVDLQIVTDLSEARVSLQRWQLRLLDRA